MIKVNEYFDGRVKSLGQESGGRRFTVGVIEPGEYSFGTETREMMEIVHGEMEVVHPDGRRAAYAKGGSFTVPSNSRFSVIVKAPVSYLCQYE
jgi:uncharacterized protein YaiE (UPF0345 family)